MQTPALSAYACRHGLDFEPSADSEDMPRERTKLAPGQRNPRFKSWTFEAYAWNEPVFIPPKAYLAFHNSAPDTLYGVVYFKAQVTAIQKYLPDSFNFKGLPGFTVNDVIKELRSKDGLREFGTPPLTRVATGRRAKVRYTQALLLAKEGKFGDIEDDLLVKYLPSFELYHKKCSGGINASYSKEIKTPSEVTTENTVDTI